MANKGGQPGNNNAGRGQIARQALEIAVRRLAASEDDEDKPIAEKISPLVDIWIKAIEKAKDDGDMQALNAIMDRLDGKPGQSINLGGQEDNPLRIQEVKVTFVDPEPESS